MDKDYRAIRDSLARRYPDRWARREYVGDIEGRPI